METSAWRAGAMICNAKGLGASAVSQTQHDGKGHTTNTMNQDDWGTPYPGKQGKARHNSTCWHARNTKAQVGLGALIPTCFRKCVSFCLCDSLILSGCAHDC